MPSQQKKANLTPGCIRREVIFPLCLVVVKPLLECSVQTRAPQHKRGMDVLERVQWRAPKITVLLEQLSCEERL